MTGADVAIVGGGFSGAMVAVHLAGRSGVDASLRLFEPGPAGRGAAYGTPCEAHLLNTRAEAMSALPGEPEHFVRWLGDRAGPKDFVPRRWYGDYVGELAAGALSAPRFEQVKWRVESIRRRGDRFELTDGSGTTTLARAVVLATGNPPPDGTALPPPILAHPGYVGDPWRFDFRGVEGTVLVIGSGLTALDVLAALELAGHRGRAYVLSRSGRFPQVHREGLLRYDVAPVLETSSAAALLRSFRTALAAATERGYDWRAVVDALRPESESLWKRLPPPERRRFDRHLRGRWERHRHRAPLAADAPRARYAAAGRLTVVGGSIRSAFESIRPDWIVNCTGPGRSARLFERAPLARMLADGLAGPDSLGWGIRVDAGLAVLDAGGAPVTGLWAVGPPARGTRLEATAVPEIRVMAQAAAAAVRSRLEGDGKTGRRFLERRAII